MNNDPSSASQHGHNDGHVAAQAAPGGNLDSEEQRKRHLQQEQKAVFLDHLIRNIDIMIYCQLSVLYYME